MGNNKMVKIAAVVMVFTIAAASLVSGTYAKYVSKASGTDSVTVAKWDIRVGAGESAPSIYNADGSVKDNVTFSLFDTINDTLDHADETDVANTKIAPGTEGSFDLVIQNKSEVTAKYGVDFTVTNTSNVPLEFKVGGDDAAWSTSLEDVAAAEATKMEAGTSATVTVAWRWAFERGTTDADKATNNIADTVLGDTTPTVTVKADLTVEQVD